MRTLLTHTRHATCRASTVQTLELYSNKIGDAGVTALAKACASGSLAQLTVRSGPTASSSYLEPWHTRSPGLTVSFDVPYAHVQTLNLSCNQIGNDRVSALASACASGSLASITNIYLQNNKATQVGKEAMRDVAKARGFRVTV